MKKIIQVLLFVFLYAGIVNAQEKSAYKVVCEVDENGKVLSGSVQDLVEYVQEGNTLRVGWELGYKGKNPMWHWAEASFITVKDGHVFGQIKGIFAQATSAPNIQTPAVYLHTDKANSWVAILGTTGVFRQKFTETDDLVNMYKQMGLNEDRIKEELKKRETTKFPTRWAVSIR